MNNKPVAYIDLQDLDRLPHHDCWVNGQEHKNSVPLYTHPAEEKDNSVVTYKTKLTVEELLEVLQDLDFVTDNWSDCAAAISKKEQEK
jgi:hypothetical protein